MLTALLEILFALLAAIGMMHLFWFLFGRSLCPRKKSSLTFAVIPARGDGCRVEYALRGLLWLRQWDLWTGTILVADCGLSPEGQQLIRLLCANTPDVGLCTLNDISSLIHKEVMFYERPPEPPTK